MKTIFIPIFQGVEARNILRTDIFDILSNNEDIRLVILVSSEEKKNYFQKEFKSPNVEFVVVDEYKIPKRNGIFTFLKFNLLRTKRMDIGRRIELSESRNYLDYIFKFVFNRVFANNFFRQITRFLDYYLIKDYNFINIFEKYKPDLVFLAHLFSDKEISILRQAKKRNVSTIGLINSWDKLTSRGIIRILPDKLIVHNEIIKKEAMKYADMKENDIEIVGIPHFDIYKKIKPLEKNEFFDEMKVDKHKKIILFCPTGQFYSNIDSELLNLLIESQIKDLISHDVQIIVRFPPNDVVNLESVRNIENVIIEQPGLRFSSKRGMDWDMSEKDNKHLLDLLYNSSLVVCPPSSISIDAAVFDKPIINIKFEQYNSGYKNQNINLFYDVDHYNNIIKTGGIKIVKDEQELIFWINKYLDDPKIDSEERKIIVSEQCYNLDGKSGEKTANFILKYLNY